MNFSNASLPANIIDEIGDQNQTNVRDFPLSDWIFSVVPAYILVISVLGIVLNLIVLMHLFCCTKLKNSSEIYLSNLTGVDLLLVSSLPFWAANVYNHFNWTFGLTLCKIVNVSILMTAYCSIYFVVVIGIDWYFIVTDPFDKMAESAHFSKRLSVLVWILGFLLSLPAVFYRDLTPPFNNTTMCMINYPSMKAKLVCEASIFVFGFIIPVFIIFFCTINIIKALRKKFMEQPNEKNTFNKKRGLHRQNGVKRSNDYDYRINVKKKDKKKTATLALAVLLAFLICWVPFHLTKILSLLVDVGILTEYNSIQILLSCQQIFVYLAFFNSVLNPILYVMLRTKFQMEIKKLFRQKGFKRNASRNEASFRYNSYKTKESQSLNYGAF